jgi:hypothetical protein
MSLQAWHDFLFDSIYLGVFWKSVRISLTVSVICVALAYPVAYFLALVAGRRKYTLLLVTIAPFLTSYLLRVLAWRVLLNNQGVIQSFLRNVGVLGRGRSIGGSSCASSGSSYRLRLGAVRCAADSCRSGTNHSRPERTLARAALEPSEGHLPAIAAWGHRGVRSCSSDLGDVTPPSWGTEGSCSATRSDAFRQG